MTTPFIYLRFSQTDTDTMIYFTHFTITTPRYFWAGFHPKPTRHYFFLLWAEHSYSPQDFPLYFFFLFIWAKPAKPNGYCCSFSFSFLRSLSPKRANPIVFSNIHTFPLLGSPFSWHQVPCLPLTLFHETKNHLWAVNPLDKRNIHPRLVTHGSCVPLPPTL